MNKIPGNISRNPDPLKVPGGIFRELEVPFEKSREEIWAVMDKKISDRPARGPFRFTSGRFIYSIAAAILLLAGVFTFIRFYTTSVECPAGRHLTYILPDESTLELNADSRMTFKPLWWSFSRQIYFEGEGFFEVQKGKSFTVISEVGKTQVLGTSFNIFARNREYKVSCITGKVKVTSFASKETVLSPAYEASISPEGELSVSKETLPDASLSWTRNMFNFTARPLIRVVEEIARQYNVTVNYSSGQEYFYTGYFSKDRPVEEVLALVTKPFGLTFAKISEKEYVISQN